MDFQEYQQDAERTITQENAHSRFIEYGFGLAGEAGEAVDILKKHLFHGHSLDIEKLKTELGDLLWYITATAFTAGISLENIAKTNITKRKDRYPDGFFTEKSINRQEE